MISNLELFADLSIPAKPFLKWAGGKSQIIDNLKKYIPHEYGQYIEPFVGGGALFFYLRPKNAVISDSNPELVNCYRVVKDNAEKLIRILSSYPHSKDFYYDIRSQDPNNLNALERAARFIYLNKTCYNGLYRVNKKGQFNVPFGLQKNPKICDVDGLRSASQALEHAIIEEGDYLTILKQYAKTGDFVFLDPPYHPIGGHADFKRYTKEFFYESNQEQLAQEVSRLVNEGISCLLTNSNTSLTRKLYEKYQYEVIETKRNINSKGSKRNNGEDLIVFAGTASKKKDKSFGNRSQINSSIIENFPGTRFMGSKYNILEFIWNSVSDLKFSSVLDAFSGSGSVSYLFKTKNKQVYSNDLLQFCFHTSNALIANSSTQLKDEDFEILLSSNPKAQTFIQDTFKGLYFSDEDNAFLDLVSANINHLYNSTKRSLALAALVRACLKRRPRGIFAYVGERYNDNRMDVRRSLREHFIIAAQEFNRAVFNNKQTNFAYNCDVFDLEVNPDLVYIDPPYYSTRADSDYLRRYHFVEGLVRYWQGVEIQEHTKTKKFAKYPTPFDGKVATYKAFPRLFEKYRDSILVVSYSSNSLPSKTELVDMLKQYKKEVRVHQIEHKYSFGTQHSEREANDVEEYVFIGI